MYVSLTYPLNIVQHTLSQIVEHCKLESLTTPDNIVWSTVTSCWANNVCQFDLSLSVIKETEDATPLRVDGISCKGCFSRSLPSRTPIYYYLPNSNYIILAGDNLGVFFFVFKKGSSRNSSSNFYLQNLAKLYLQSPFLLDLRYIGSESNPADCLTRRFFLFFFLFGMPKFCPLFFSFIV